jgi:hypothetical protein
VKEEDFYVGPDFLLTCKDRTKKLKDWVYTYMDILAIVGRKEAENIFTELRA